jgi:hypothetical protein
MVADMRKTLPPEQRFAHVESWISEGPDEPEIDAYIQALTTEAEKLEGRLADTRAKIQQATEVRELRRRWFKTEGGVSVATAEITSTGTVVGEIPRGRTAVRLVLNAYPHDRKWRARDVLNVMIESGWATEKDLHSVQVALSRMFRKKELQRPEQGVYRLPPQPGESRPEGDGESANPGLQNQGPAQAGEGA